MGHRESEDSGVRTARRRGWCRSGLRATMPALVIAARIPSLGAAQAPPLLFTEPRAPGIDPEDARLIDAAKTFIPHVMRLKGTPGLSLALARHGRVLGEAGRERQGRI